jgi:hypothetical protein
VRHAQALCSDGSELQPITPPSCQFAATTTTFMICCYVQVVAAQVLPHPPVKRGDSLHLAGLTKFLRIMTRRSTVTTATSAITIPAPEVPR